MRNKRLIFPLVIAGLVLVFIIAKGGLKTNLNPTTTQPGKVQQMKIVPTPTVTLPVVEGTESWTLYDNGKLVFKYPPQWKLNPSEEYVTFNSADYVKGKNGGPTAGFSVTIFANIKSLFNQNSLVSTKNTTWLGNKATLQVYNSKGSNLVLTGKYQDTTYQFVLSAASESARIANQETFLKFTNSFGLR